MKTQPEALRLATDLPVVKYTGDWVVCDHAAAELRRLHAENTQLRATLETISRMAVANTKESA